MLYCHYRSILKLTPTKEQQLQHGLAVLHPNQREAIMELVSEWEVKGRVEEALTLVSRLLQHKLGLLPPEITDRLGALAITQLEALAEALLDFTAADDLTTWLEAQASQLQSSS